MRPVRRLSPVLAACALLAGCATGSSTPASVPQHTPPSSTSATRVRPHPLPARQQPTPGDTGLANSTASAQVVQAQPAPGYCHAPGRGLYTRPDPRCTPGALNPAVTPATIERTICVSGWTSTVRPPEPVTEAEKRASMAAYGATGAMSGYEYDHFVPLELGGAVNDPRNLWPEPGASPNPKDAVEDELNRRVCDGQMSLAAAQRAIVANWTRVPGAPPGPEQGAAPAPRGEPAGAQCSAHAAYSNAYGDFDVYVRSNQPDETVTVSDSSGDTDSWHTDSGGSADVYFKAPESASGETATVTIGRARCQTNL